MDIALDLTALKSMFPGEELLQRAILQEFKSTAGLCMEELDAALENRDSHGVRLLAHKLKSSSFAIGAEALGQYCEDLESSATETAWEPTRLHVWQLKASMTSVISQIEELMDS